MENRQVRKVTIKKIAETKAAIITDYVAAEEPMEIQLLYTIEGAQTRKPVSVTMRTPGNDTDLAIGFLFTEGIIQSYDQIYKAAPVPGNENILLVSLEAGVEPALNGVDRNFYMTSACGICGKASIDAIKTVSVYKNTPTPSLRVMATILFSLQDKLLAQQEIFDSTGGLHAAALFDQNGAMLMLREDVGRHNALDKLIGAALSENKLPLRDHILLLSGRASFELVQKAAMAGIFLIAAVGAPSSLAVSMANEAGITLVGFLRAQRFNIYTHPERIILVE